MLFHAGTLDDDLDQNRKTRPARSRGLAVYLLTPGFTIAYHANVFRVSRTTINKLLTWSRAFAAQDVTIGQDVERNVGSITPDDGMRMAQRRGSAHMPWWARLALSQFAVGRQDTAEVAELFKCSRRTVQQVLRVGSLAFDPFTGARRPSPTQLCPPGKWAPGSSPSVARSPAIIPKGPPPPPPPP